MVSTSLYWRGMVETLCKGEYVNNYSQLSLNIPFWTQVVSE